MSCPRQLPVWAGVSALCGRHGAAPSLGAFLRERQAFAALALNRRLKVLALPRLFSSLWIRPSEMPSMPLWAHCGSLCLGSDARAALLRSSCSVGLTCLNGSPFRYSSAPCYKCSISSHRMAQQLLCALGSPEWIVLQVLSVLLASHSLHRNAQQSLCASGPPEREAPSGAKSLSQLQHQLASL